MTTAQQVAAWAKKAREATQRRDAAIRAMRAEGATLRAIAEAAGLTHAAIAKIVAKDRPMVLYGEPDVAVYGTCEQCGAPRRAWRRLRPNDETLSMCCSADESHGPDVPA